ncbi:MAG: ThiF family adenylyltransferase [Paenisporosarcina sp.]
MWKIQHGFRINLKDDTILLSNSWLDKFYSIRSNNIEKLYIKMKEIQKLEFFTEDEIIGIFQTLISNTEALNLINYFKKNKIMISYNKMKDYSNAKYHRQEVFFDNFESSDENGHEINRQLQNKTVLIPGLGGYGTYTAMLLARMGIKKIILVDNDVIELSNLNRQVFYEINDIGRKKVEVCKEKIHLFDENICVEIYDFLITGPNDLVEILDDVDLVMNAFGYIPKELQINNISHNIIEACILTKTPVLNYNGSFIGPVVTEDYPNAYYEFASNKEVFDTLKNSVNENINATHIAAFVPRISISCSVAVWEAVRYLLKVPTRVSLEKQVIILDTLAYTKHRVIKI